MYSFSTIFLSFNADWKLLFKSWNALSTRKSRVLSNEFEREVLKWSVNIWLDIASSPIIFFYDRFYGKRWKTFIPLRRPSCVSGSIYAWGNIPWSLWDLKFWWNDDELANACRSLLFLLLNLELLGRSTGFGCFSRLFLFRLENYLLSTVLNI